MLTVLKKICQSDSTGESVTFWFLWVINIQTFSRNQNIFKTLFRLPCSVLNFTMLKKYAKNYIRGYLARTEICSVFSKTTWPLITGTWFYWCWLNYWSLSVWPKCQSCCNDLSLFNMQPCWQIKANFLPLTANLWLLNPRGELSGACRSDNKTPRYQTGNENSVNTDNLILMWPHMTNTSWCVTEVDGQICYGKDAKRPKVIALWVLNITQEGISIKPRGWASDDYILFKHSRVSSPLWKNFESDNHMRRPQKQILTACFQSRRECPEEQTPH